MKPLLCIAAIIAGATAAKADEPIKHTTDTPAKVKALVVQGKALLVDVREDREWDAGHLSDAIHLPLSRLQQGVDPKSLEKEVARGKPLYLHCAGGRRVIPAGEVLRELGYDVRPLRQGYADLLKSGFEAAEE